MDGKRMTTYLISRHPGAIAWLNQAGYCQATHLSHLNPEIIHPGDQVVGTLPVHLAAQVCARGGRYLHLVLQMPEHLRGQELSTQQLVKCQATIEEFSILPVSATAQSRLR
jgi:CRISPR-associated protein Csx16